MENKTSLRKRAEAFLDKHPEAVQQITRGDVQQLVEDLHIHQIELEMQNDELRKTQRKLEASRDRFSDLYDFAPVGYMTASDKGFILEANLTMAAMLGVERIYLIGKPLSRFIIRDDQDRYYLFRKNLLGTETHRTLELKLIRKDGTWFYARLEGIAVEDPEENTPLIRIAVTDITERKQAEEALKKAHDELDRKVKARTAELTRANTKLKREIEERKLAVQTLEHALVEIKELKNRLEAEKTYLQEEIKSQYNYENIIGNSDELRYTLYKVEQIAPTNTAVIILGETGTGKELIARAIHGTGPRKNRAFVKVNCAALPSNLIESELFGHEKGAFSGAVAQRLGRFEVADGATLFLDEIGELPLELQTKLLRVIQDSEFERLGSSQTIKVDVRVIAATNRNLEEDVRSGRFRQDLWYRLNVFPITVPPLRSRMEDLPVLVKFFVNKVSKKLGKSIDHIPKSVMNTLGNYHWPGNVRELENVIERAVINASGNKLRLMDTLEKAQKVLAAAPKTLEKVERDYIIRILDETRWKVAGKNGAAEILGLNPSTLRARMRKLGIRKP
ncbi:MAG: sigma 54-interacting transcriptional regulator [Desulfobacterales bacterium]